MSMPTTTQGGEEGKDLLVHKHVFGLKVGAHGHLQYLDENLVLFPCGHNAVIYNTETRAQSLIHGSNAGGNVEAGHSEGITALAVSPNRRTIAIAERAAVSLYDVAQPSKRRRLLQHGDIGSTEIRFIAFSGDSKQVLTVGGAPSWTMVLWTTDRAAKVTATIKLAPQVTSITTSEGIKTPSSEAKSSLVIRQADFSPTDPNIICVTGNEMFRIFKVGEGTFKPLPLGFKREALDYTCHAWLPEDMMVVASKSGEIILFHNFEFCAIIAPPDGRAISSLHPFSKGFICGGAGGVMRIFDKTGDSSWYKCGGSKEYKIEKNDSPIVRMAVAPSEENLICSTANHQSYIFALGSTEILKSGDPGVKFFEFLTGSAVHGPGPSKSAAINGMDVCVWKPLLITCGSDHTVRIWNYKERTVELTKQFSDEPLSVALHPAGLFAIVGFVDKVRVVSLLMEDMQKVKDIPVKGCRVCGFSKGGHMFAIANQSVVQLFDTYTCAVQSQLRGHNQAVRSITWADRDRRIVTVGKDGNVFLWDVRSGSRLQESMQARSTFHTATLAGDANSPSSRVFAYASDMTIRSFVAATMAPEIQVQSTIPISCMVANMNGRALFLGTCTPGQPSVITSLIMKDARFPGRTAAQLAAAAAQAAAAAASEAGGPDASSRVDNKALLNLPTEKGAFPPASPMSQVDSQSCVAHSSAMTCIRLSVDGNTLFTGGEDGSICMFEVRDVDARGTIRLQNSGKDGKGESGSMGSVEEVLVTKNELVSKKRETNKLLQKVEELKKSNDHQLRQKEMLYDERIKDVTDKFQAELDACKGKYSTLMSEKDKVEFDFEQRLESLRGANKKELEERDQLYSVKIETERERKEALHAERKRQMEEWEASNRTIEAEQQEELKALEAIYEVKANREQEEQQELHCQKDLLINSWEKKRTQIENDSDFEVEEIKMKYEERLKAEQDTTVSLKGEHVVMKQEYQLNVKDVKEQEDKIKALAVLEHQLRDVYKGLEKDIQAHKNEIRDRDVTISEKDKRIYDLKKKNQELEKFKFVLDYKIKELKRQIEPRENEIADMRTQVEEMDVELSSYHKSNAALELMIGELRLKIDGMQREIDSQHGTLGNVQNYLAVFRRDLMNCDSQAEYKQLKSNIRSIFAKYVQQQGGTMNGTNGGVDPQQEYNREREHLERNVEALKKKMTKDMDMLMGDHARLTREGVNLTEEMNLLRREAKILRRQQKSMDMEADEIANGEQRASRTAIGTSSLPPPPPQFSASTAAQKELEMQETQLLTLENRARELQMLLGLDQ